MQGILWGLQQIYACSSRFTTGKGLQPKRGYENIGGGSATGAQGGEITSVGEWGVGEAENTTGVVAFKFGEDLHGQRWGRTLERGGVSRSKEWTQRQRERDKASYGNSEPSGSAEAQGTYGRITGVWDSQGKEEPCCGVVLIAGRGHGEFILSSTSSHEPLEISEHEYNTSWAVESRNPI